MTKATATMTAWCNVAAPHWEEFQRWHGQEHLPERVGIPGFLRGSRWHSRTRATGILAFYELEDLEVFNSEAYVDRLNQPTEWTTRLMPSISDMVRTPFRITAQAGAGQAASLLTLGFSPSKGSERHLRTWSAEVAAKVVADGIPSVRLLEAEVRLEGQRTKEHELRGQLDELADWCLLVMGSDVALQTLGAELASQMAEQGAIKVIAERYELAHSLTRDDLALTDHI